MSQGNKKAVTFLKKSNQKTFDYPRLLRGQTVAAQKPGVIKSFLLLFFKKEVLASF
jgi:hypothetical protein